MRDVTPSLRFLNKIPSIVLILSSPAHNCTKTEHVTCKYLVIYLLYHIKSLISDKVKCNFDKVRMRKIHTLFWVRFHPTQQLVDVMFKVALTYAN